MSEEYDALRRSVLSVDPAPCPVCRHVLTRFGRTCKDCERDLEEERIRKEIEGQA